jgi:cobalt/nickel transport system permease protein
MAGIHMLIGLGEAVITIGAVAFLYSARRDLLEAGGAQGGEAAVWMVGAFISAILIGLAPFASTRPDSLEWVAEQQGFLGMAREPFLRLIPDYIMPGFENEAAASVLAGAFGVLLILGAYLAIARIRRVS